MADLIEGTELKNLENQLKNFERQSSKGNQLKWQNDNYWYKADYADYEGLVEYVVSKLLSKSNLKPVEYVDYELEKIKYKRNTFYGVRSEGFLSDTALDYPMNDDVDFIFTCKIVCNYIPYFKI